jgi:hypothetical protein
LIIFKATKKMKIDVKKWECVGLYFLHLMYKILFEARRPLACQKATAQMANKAWERPSVARLLSFCLYLLRLEFLFRSPITPTRRQIYPLLRCQGRT